jgi:archaellum biogenesis ATPase FlaH
MQEINEQAILQWWDIFKAHNPLVEIRLIGANKTASGYFSNPHTLMREIAPYTQDMNVYWVMNGIKPECYGREQKDRIVLKPKNTTNDKEILCRDWVLIDVDCNRVAGVNASSKEAQYAYAKAEQVENFLLSQGFNRPIKVFSGSGIHLYLKCALACNESNDALIRDFLLALGMLFDDANCKIDSVVFNNSRISRLPGTWNRKGSKSSQDRPQRICRFLNIPDEIRINEKEFFQKVAALLPKEETPSKENNYRPINYKEFNLQEFFDKYNIEVLKETRIDKGTRYILKECPFDPSHGSDSMVFQYDSGPLAFYCFHNGCTSNHWKEFRAHFDRDAYSRQARGEWKQREWREKPKVETPRPVETPAPDGNEWLSMEDIQYLDLKNLAAIPTGHEVFDRKALGFILGEISIVSGLNGSGKSSWLNCITLNAIQRGFKVAMFSGELMKEKVKVWLNQVAAGREYVKKVYGYDDFYYVPKDVTAKIDAWTKGKIFLYDNKYGRNWSRLLESIRNVVEQKQINLLILDNLMTLDLDAFSGDKNDRQSSFVNSLADLAKQTNIHIILVAHPRKSLTFLRREDIGGSGDITNLADNVYIIHRCNKDFEKRAPEFLGQEEVTKLTQYDCYSNVVEVCKNRFVGSVDNIFGYYYEAETKRFMQSKTEHVVYGWNPPVIQQSMSFDEFAGINNNEWRVNDFDDLPPDEFNNF